MVLNVVIFVEEYGFEATAVRISEDANLVVTLLHSRGVNQRIPLNSGQRKYLWRRIRFRSSKILHLRRFSQSA
jgi:hypothetical protein